MDVNVLVNFVSFIKLENTNHTVDGYKQIYKYIDIK